MTAPWPCATCGGLGIRNLGTKGYCAAHLSELYRRFPAEVWDLQGISLQAGPRRPDFGPEYVELECSSCGAGWVGALLERCPWCAELRERMVEWQAEHVLTPPDVDRDDRGYESRMRAWADRLASAVRAEIITESQARAVWDRAGGRDVAA